MERSEIISFLSDELFRNLQLLDVSAQAGDTGIKEYLENHISHLEYLLRFFESEPVAWMAAVQVAGGPELAPEWDEIFQAGASRPSGQYDWTPLFVLPAELALCAENSNA